MFAAGLYRCTDNIQKRDAFLASLCLRNITGAQKKTEDLVFTISVACWRKTLEFSCRHVIIIFYLWVAMFNTIPFCQEALKSQLLFLYPFEIDDHETWTVIVINNTFCYLCIFTSWQSTVRKEKQEQIISLTWPCFFSYMKFQIVSMQDVAAVMRENYNFECGTTVCQGHNLVLLNNSWLYCCFCKAEPWTVAV